MTRHSASKNPKRVSIISLRSLSIVAILFTGLYCVSYALYLLALSAWFVIHAQVLPATVVDESKRPFESIFEQLRHGNMPWDGDTAFHPHLRYTLYGRPIVDTTLPDLDNRSFPNGSRVSLLIHPQKPHQRHIYKAKFLWVAPSVLLLTGSLLLLSAYLLLKKRRPAPTPPPQAPPPLPEPQKQPPPTPKPTPASPKKRKPKTTKKSPRRKKSVTKKEGR